MALDLSISLGNLLTLLTLGVGGIWFLAQIGSRIDLLALRLQSFEDTIKSDRQRLDALGDKIDKLAEAVSLIAVQAERLDNLDERLSELSKRINDIDRAARKPPRAR